MWADLDDGDPDLTKHTEGLTSACMNLRFPQYIDHIVTGPRATALVRSGSFEQVLFTTVDPGGQARLSDTARSRWCSRPTARSRPATPSRCCSIASTPWRPSCRRSGTPWPPRRSRRRRPDLDGVDFTATMVAPGDSPATVSGSAADAIVGRSSGPPTAVPSSAVSIACPGAVGRAEVRDAIRPRCRHSPKPRSILGCMSRTAFTMSGASRLAQPLLSHRARSGVRRVSAAEDPPRWSGT